MLFEDEKHNGPDKREQAGGASLPKFLDKREQAGGRFLARIPGQKEAGWGALLAKIPGQKGACWGALLARIPGQKGADWGASRAANLLVASLPGSNSAALSSFCRFLVVYVDGCS